MRDDRTKVRYPLHASDSHGGAVGTPLAVPGGVTGAIWVTDREPGVRAIFGELFPEAEVLDPAEFYGRLAIGQRPDALVIDGTQLLSLAATVRRELQALPRLLICTGLSLASLPRELVSGPGVAILAKPFCVDDLEAAASWLDDGLSPDPLAGAPLATVVQRRRPRAMPRRSASR